MQNVKINTSSPYFTGALAILLGLVMCIWPSQIIKYIINILGWFMILTGGIPIIISLIKKRPISLVSVITLIFGIVILSFAYFFINVVMWIFGIILIIGAIQQFNIMNEAKRGGAKVSFVNMIYPALLLLAGVLILVNTFTTIETVVIFFGASTIFYGLTIILNQYRFNKMLNEIKSQSHIYDISDKQ